MLGWLGFAVESYFGVWLDYLIAGALVGGGVYLLIAFWPLRLVRIAAALLIVGGIFVGAFSFGKSVTLADCISQAHLAQVQSELDAAKSSIATWKATAELRSEQLRELSKRRSEANAHIADWQAEVPKLSEAVRRGRAASRDDDRRLCGIARGQAPGC